MGKRMFPFGEKRSLYIRSRNDDDTIEVINAYDGTLCDSFGLIYNNRGDIIKIHIDRDSIHGKICIDNLSYWEY